MGFTVCGREFSPPSIQQIATHASAMVTHVLRSARVIELYEYVSQELRESMAKVQQVFEESKEVLFFISISAVSACLDPSSFFGAFAVGAVSNFVIELMYGTTTSTSSVFLNRAYEFFIAQTALVGVHIGCKAVQSTNYSFFPTAWKEGSVSSMISGVIAGATMAAIIRRLYALAIERLATLVNKTPVDAAQSPSSQGV